MGKLKPFHLTLMDVHKTGTSMGGGGHMFAEAMVCHPSSELVCWCLRQHDKLE